MTRSRNACHWFFDWLQQESFSHNSLYKILFIYKKKFIMVISTNCFNCNCRFTHSSSSCIYGVCTHTHTHTHFVTNHHMKKCVSLIFVWIAIKKFFPQFKNFAKLHQSISKKELVPKWCQTISAMCNSDLVLILCLGK